MPEGRKLHRDWLEMNPRGEGPPRGNALHERWQRPEKARPATCYFKELLIDVNWVLRVVPSPLTAAMIARAMPAAISPYSIAVAPASSDRNFLK